MSRALGPKLVVSADEIAVSADDIVRRSIDLAHADRGQRVSVAGPESLAALISLCREGFDHVECARRSTCPCADEASDLLLIAGLLPAADLADLLRRTCRLLRDGGTLIVQLQRSADDAAVRSALAAAGVVTTSSRIDGRAACLAVHTVARAALALRQAS